MIQTFQNIDDIDKNQWESLLQRSSNKSAFQTPECYKFYSSLSFMETFVAAVAENEELKGVVVGFILKDGGKIKQFLSRRAIVNGGPLLAEDISAEAFSALMENCKMQIKRKAIYLEMRNLSDYSNRIKNYIESGFKYEPHLGYIVDTPSEEEVNHNIEKRRMQSIRSALRNGVSITTQPSKEELHQFYALLDHLYKTRVKTPLYPFEFFQKLSQQSFGITLLLQYEGKIIGGQISFCMKDYAVYDLFMTGDDITYKKLRPSTLATYSGIQYAANNNCKYCDLMGAGKPGEKYGVRDFKASFGGRLVEYGRCQYICNPLLYNIGKLGIAIIKKLK